MSLITRNEKGSLLTIDEMDNNLLYLERLGLNKEQIKEAYNLAIQEPNFMFNAGSFEDFEPILKLGAFKATFEIGAFFRLFEGPINIQDWNNGPATIPIEGIFVGSKINPPDALTINGYSFPIQNDAPILGYTSVINAEDTFILISDFIEVHYQYLLDGQNYLHEFLVRIGSNTFFSATIEGDNQNIQLLFNDII